MANDYCTTTEAKAAFPDTSWSTTYDTLFGLLATRVSREIDRFTGRHPGAYYVTTDSTRYFTGSGDLRLAVGELSTAPTTVSMALSGVVDNSAGTGGTYTDLSASDYLLYPYNAADFGRPYQVLEMDLINGSYAAWYSYPKAIKIVGKFGYSTAIPDEVKQATITQVFRWFKRSQQAFTDSGVNVDLGEMVYRKALDPEVTLMIEHLRRQAI